MYLLVTDETNQQAGEKARFFIYGGIFSCLEHLAGLHDLVEKARRGMTSGRRCPPTGRCRATRPLVTSTHRRTEPNGLPPAREQG